MRDNLDNLRAGNIAVTSQAIGDLICASSTTAFARLAAVATGQILVSNGTGSCPVYSTTLVVSGAGPHAIGGATDGRRAIGLRGAFTSNGSGVDADWLLHDGGLTGAAGDTTRLSLMTIAGTIATQTATEGILNIESLVLFESTITDNLTGTITNASTFRIASAPDEGTNDYYMLVGSNAFAIEAGGNVGIGTASPGSLLSLQASTNLGISIDSTQSNGDEWQIVNANSGALSQLQFKNVDTALTLLTLDQNGRVEYIESTLQHLYTEMGTDRTTTSTTFAAVTGLNQSITTTNSTTEVCIFVAAPFEVLDQSTNPNGRLKLRRDTTDLRIADARVSVAGSGATTTILDGELIIHYCEVPGTGTFDYNLQFAVADAANTETFVITGSSAGVATIVVEERFQ